MFKGCQHTETTKQRLSEATKRAHLEGRCFSFYKGKSLPPEVREKISKTKKGSQPWNKGLSGWMSPEHSQHLAALKRGQTPWNKDKPFRHSGSFQKGHPDISRNKGRKRTEAQRKNTSELVKMLWSNPDYASSQLARIYRSLQRKPNKAESSLKALLETSFPSQWEYVGDGKVILNRLIPDFINKNGLKAVIELFGDYWHKEKALKWQQTELGRIMAYNSLGFKCLVIWEHELKRPEAVIDKIRAFRAL